MRLLFMIMLLFPTLAQATVAPSERMGDHALDSRAQALYQQVRCVVCEGQSIAGSNAEMASALRALIRQKLKAGQTDQEILSFLQSRYGPEVLMKPPLTPATVLLWFMPVLALAAGFLITLRLYKSRAS